MDITLTILSLIILLFSVVTHEVAHGSVAYSLGDPTAKYQGRLTLNPIKHLDMFGSIMLPLLFLLVTAGQGPIFGWAKPVPVNFANLRHPKRDMLWVAAAGPLSNLAMALLWALALKIGLALPGSSYALPLALMGAAGVFVNVILMVLNLLPLPPLDGGRILASLLPQRMADVLSRIEPYGFIILIVLLFTGMLGYVLWPLIGLSLSLIAGAFGVPIGQLLRLAQLV